MIPLKHEDNYILVINRYHATENHSFASLEEAINLACASIEFNLALPIEIRLGDQLLMSRDKIMEEWNKRYNK